MQDDSDIPWYERGRCKGMDTDIWFPDFPKSYQRAVSICVRCDVRWECLEDALKVESRDTEYGIHGVRGGFTPPQRAKFIERNMRNAV